MTKVKAINDFVFITPIENKKEGSIELLSDDRMYRKGIIYSIKDDSEYKVGDSIVYSDSCTKVQIDGMELHMVKEGAIYFNEVDNM